MNVVVIDLHLDNNQNVAWNILLEMEETDKTAIIEIFFSLSFSQIEYI